MAQKRDFTCPNDIEWMILAPYKHIPFQNRGAWYSWCDECTRKFFKSIRGTTDSVFFDNFYWYPARDHFIYKLDGKWVSSNHVFPIEWLKTKRKRKCALIADKIDQKKILKKKELSEE